MRIPNRIHRQAALLAAVFMALSSGLAVGQSKPIAPTPKPVATDSQISEADLAETQDQLLKLLRVSPTLTEVVSRDPSLLANEEYVSHNNPALGQFLQAHPEVARNPSFYLFTNLPERNGRSRERALELKVWPEQERNERQGGEMEEFMRDLGPLLGFACFLGTAIWLIRVILENRRWGRIFKLQTEVHGRLIDRFASNQELLTYMETESGKKFLEAAPIPVNFEQDHRVPNAVARVLTPLQIGVVLTLLGAGMLLLRNSVPGEETHLLVLGVVALMPGLGFIISAGITWVLAARLGLMPERETVPQRESDPSSRELR